MSKTKIESKAAQVVNNLFDEEVFNGIQKYVENVVPALRCAVDKDIFVRNYIHNNSFFVDIHHQLADFASEMFKERVKPSYCFLSLYKNGGKCPLHIDRPQCRYTIDYLVRATSSKPWPISISDPLSKFELTKILDGHPKDQDIIDRIISDNTWTTIDLQPNDAVLYSGTNSWHYRPTALQGEADLVFFHFVPEGFSDQLN